jgi:hypothetical protein
MDCINIRYDEFGRRWRQLGDDPFYYIIRNLLRFFFNGCKGAIRVVVSLVEGGDIDAPNLR